MGRRAHVYSHHEKPRRPCLRSQRPKLQFACLTRDRLGAFACCTYTLGSVLYLKGQRNLVTWLIIGKTRVTIWFVGLISLFTKS